MCQGIGTADKSSFDARNLSTRQIIEMHSRCYGAAAGDSDVNATAQQIAQRQEIWGGQQGLPNIVEENENAGLRDASLNRPRVGRDEKVIRHGVVENDFKDHLHAGEDETRSLTTD